MKKYFDSIKNKRLLILGLGKEGMSTYKLLREKFPNKVLGIADSNPKVKETLNHDKNLEFYIGNGYLQSIKNYDLLFKSPGISLKKFKCSDKEKITSQTDMFLSLFGNQTIGVTGTKGKSTTASLIAHILKENDKEVVLLGNIGIPAFDKLADIKPDTIVVFELSAHQLEYVHHSPKVAVLLNIFPEHLDHFKSYKAYRNAKLNVAAFQQSEDLLISTKTLENDFKSFKSTILYVEDADEIVAWKVKLKGAHNLNNVKVAIMAVNYFGVDYEQALKTAGSFEPLPHRMEYVGKFDDIHFYNDSISTVPESAIAAIIAIGNIDTLILGGFDRGLDYSKLVSFIENNPVKNIIFTGPAGKTMLTLFNKNPNTKINLFEAENIEEAFEIIKLHTSKDGVCLLSPAASSYDQFNNFEHRGDVFKSLAKKLQ